MPASAPFGGASPRSGRPHPGPLRRGQRRSSPGRLCPAPGPQPRSHGNQAGPRYTPARPPAGACARSRASRIPAGERSCSRTYRVAPAYVEKSVPGGACTPQFREGRGEGVSHCHQVRAESAAGALQCALCSANPRASSCEPYTARASSAWRPGAARSCCTRAASASRWAGVSGQALLDKDPGYCSHGFLPLDGLGRALGSCSLVAS